jgi:RNA polymerase sigma-70 factor (ECF subfamily)
MSKSLRSGTSRLARTILMDNGSPQTTQLQGLLERFAAGDPNAPDALIRRACERLRQLTSQMLRGYPGVKRWAETDDVLQSALMRLLRSLKDVRPATPRDFFALATLQIRRELLDLARHYFGPEGAGANHASHGRDSAAGPIDKADSAAEPSQQAEWCEFHRIVETLPQDERDVVGLLYYHGMTQAEAAEILGVTVRTVQRRWHSSLLQLHKVLKSSYLES